MCDHQFRYKWLTNDFILLNISSYYTLLCWLVCVVCVCGCVCYSYFIPKFRVKSLLFPILRLSFRFRWDAPMANAYTSSLSHTYNPTYLHTNLWWLVMMGNIAQHHHHHSVLASFSYGSWHENCCVAVVSGVTDCCEYFVKSYDSIVAFV